MTPVGNVMILASAGSGKTYALTNRFVRLLASGVPPERIVALTFTRKAAGEFFDEILNKLAVAASDPERAAGLAREIEAPGLGCAGFLGMLRAVTGAMHRLNLGTFDGFFARLVRNFPLELGLAGDFEILDGAAVAIERARVLRRIFAGPGALTEAQRAFIEAFKRATFGAEEKRMGSHLDRFLDQYQEVFLAGPDPACWGHAERIWPEGCAWLEAAGDRTGAVRTLRAVLAGEALTDGQRRRWEDFFAALEEWTPSGTLPAQVAYILQNAFKVWNELKAGSAGLMVDRRRQLLGPDACKALVAVVGAVVGAEFRRRLEMTRGIHAVLQAHEAFYHELVRRAGRLTFADVQRLLLPAAGAPRLGAGRKPQEDDGDDPRLFIDFRLDACFEHWLLDEFQDTSFGQWSVLQNLIDEAVQDPTGRRSFFYVGDVKQAIFTWREGDPRLFREIFDHYNSGRSAAIREERLDRSFRSGPAIIETVNRVFGAGEVLRRMFPAAVADAWAREWRDHASAHPEIEGQAALLHAEDEAGRFARTLDVLREVRPLERGLTCAVLVRTNDVGARLADYLRREGGLAALAEADLHVCTDNPVGAALLALFKAGAHPGDAFAWEHLHMTALGAALEAEGLASPDGLTLCLLGGLHTDGFEQTVEFWLRRLEPGLEPGDAFSRERGAQFAAAARMFDATGSRDMDEFIRFMEGFTERATESASAVRVMTVHKAKGLGFDLVVLPDLEGSRLDQRRDGLAVEKAADRSVKWVLDLPPKLFHDADEVLSAHVRREEAESCYEQLSLLYVAMTRARRAMYLIVEPPGRSASNNFPRLLTAALGEMALTVPVGRLTLPGSFSTGVPGWHLGAGSALRSQRIEAAIERVGTGGVRRRVRLSARRPSDRKAGRVPGAELFSPAGGKAADFGAAVHALFASVEWWAPADADAWTAAQRGACADEAALSEVLGCLNDPALARVFARPPGPADVWRERPFEGVLDGMWITGVFDRVVIERDGVGGSPARVTVVDFKSDRVEEPDEILRATERHAGQLGLYRRAAALLAGVSPARVDCQLVFTACHRAAPAPPCA
jgi:ATP-dependent exoDNAse (exonuclease V) beta subunit